MNNSRRTVAITLVALAILAIAAGAFFLFRTQSPQSPMAQIPISVSTTTETETAAASSTPLAATTTPPLSQSTPATQEEPQGMRLYKNTVFHFSLSYPDDLQATEYQETDGALTVSFQDPSTNEGFEVYATPYSSTQITESRFKLDEPSGTFLQPTTVVIDGVNATMFYGHNPIMGDTREVWFIHGDFLYEVATYKALDTWLAGIMQTWKFV